MSNQREMTSYARTYGRKIALQAYTIKKASVCALRNTVHGSIVCVSEKGVNEPFNLLQFYFEIKCEKKRKNGWTQKPKGNMCV